MRIIRSSGLFCLVLAALIAACSSESSTTTDTTNPEPSGGSAGQGGNTSGGSAGQNTAGQNTAGNDGAGAGGAVAGSGGAGAGGAVAGSGGAGAGGAAAGSGGEAAGNQGAGAGGSPDPNECKTEAECAAFKTPAGQSAVPPVKAGGGNAAGETPMVHAVSRWFLGDTDRQGNTSGDAWKEYGFNLDGWSSTKEQGYHCLPIEGAKSADIRVDGKNGIDNSFGKNIVDNIFGTLVVNPSEESSNWITDGNSSYLLDLEKLGSASNYDSLPSLFSYVQGQKKDDSFVPPPAQDWSGYAWSLVENAKNGMISTNFPDAYFAKDTFVSGEISSLKVRIQIQSFPLLIPLKKAWMTLDLKDRKHGINGNLGGIIPTEELVAILKKYMGAFSTSLCDDTGVEGILSSVRQASDILQNGTQDPTKACDGISFGIGFETRVSKAGSTTQAPDDINPCD